MTAYYAPTNPRPEAEDLRKIAKAVNLTIQGTSLVTGGQLGSSIQTITAAASIMGYSTTLADATAGAFSVPIPLAASFPNAIYTIKKIDSTTNAVTLTCSGTDKIDGVASKAIATQYASLMFQSNGTGWFII